MSNNSTITENPGEGLRQLRGKALWAALATLIDAEGSIELPKYGNNYWTQIKIGNVNKEWLDCWQLRLGRGTVIKGEQAKNSRRVWRLVFRRKADIAYILKRALPYLFIKIPQALLALEFIEKKGIYSMKTGDTSFVKRIPEQELAWREECFQKMRKLNAKGNPERLHVESPTVESDIVPSAEPSAELDDNVLVH